MVSGLNFELVIPRPKTRAIQQFVTSYNLNPEGITASFFNTTIPSLMT